MPTSVENYIFGELPRRLVVDSTADTGTSLTAGWVIVATGNGFQAVPVDPSALGFEPTLAPATGDPITQYYRGDKTWKTLDAAAVGAIASSEKGTALGVATLDADGYVLLSQMNPSVVERVVIVADEAARYALTTLDVQNGDVVNQQSPLPATMWFVVDQNNLDSSAGYLPFSAGVAASVAWSGITGKPAILGDLENISLAAEGDLIQFVAGNWVNVEVASLKDDLALGISDIGLLQNSLDAKQGQADVLDALTSFSNQLNSTGILVRNGDGLILGREIVGTNGIAVTEGKGDADNISLSLTEVGTAGTYGDDDNYPTYDVDAYGRVTSTTVKSLVKDTLTLLDQVADQTLAPNTTYQVGAYVETLNLLVPDPVVGGTKITLEVPPILGTPVGDINVSFPSGKELFGFVPSLSLKSMMNPLPGDRITFTYIDNLSQWVVYKAPGLYLRELYLVGDSTANPTLEPSFFHSVASKATDSRVLSIPDRDVDLSSVGQTEFTSSEFSVVDTTDPSKKVAFSVGSVGAGNTSIITVPDSPVDLGLVGKTDFADTAFRISDNLDSTKKVAIEASSVGTGQVRAITMPNSNVDLGKVPTNLAYNSATAVLTQTLTDSSSLSADLSATAVSQIVLTGSATVVVSATQPSTKYFLAGSTVGTFDVTAFTNTGKFIEIVNNSGSYFTITLTATGKSFKDEANDNVTMPITLVRGESVFVFPVSESALQVYRNKPDIRNIKNNSNTVISGFKTTNLFVDASFSLTGHLSANADEILRIFALANSTINFGADVYDARTDTQISTGSYTLYAGQVLEVTKTSATKWVVLGGHIQDTSRFRLYNSSNVPTKFDTSAATAERTITMPNADVNLGALKSLNTLPVGVTQLVQLKAGHEYFVTQSGIILNISITTILGLYDTSIGYSFSNTTSSDLTVTVRWSVGVGAPTIVSHVDAISGFTIGSTYLFLIGSDYDYTYTIPKGGTIRLLPNAASNVTILRSFREFYGQMAVELLASSAAQTLAPSYSHYLPASYAGALNLTMPAGAAIGTTLDISSIYSTGLDGTSGVNLTALNLTVPAGEYITGWDGATSPINLLVSYDTASTGYRTPNFTQGCTFRLTKTGATSWAIKPTFGSALPQKFIVKNEGVGGTIVSTTVPAGTSRELTLPNANVDLGDLPSVATNDTNSIALAALRCRILGGQGNTVSGTGNVLINCTGATLGTPTSTTMIDSRWVIVGAPANVIAIGVKNTNIQTQPLSNTIAIGSANNNDLFTYPVAACTVNNSLFASSDSVPVSGTLYATTNGSQTLSSANCLPIPVGSGTAQYEVDFIVTVGAVGLASTACKATGCISMRRIFTVFKDNSGASAISAVDTVGTDRTLGAIGGTFTPTIALSGTTHVTVGITRAGGVAGQEAMAISCRVRAHLTR